MEGLQENDLKNEVAVITNSSLTQATAKFLPKSLEV